MNRLSAWGLLKLLKLCEAMLDCSLKDRTHDHFTLACSFLNNVMKIAGYGRACKYTSAPRSAPERSTDELAIRDEIKKDILKIHEASVHAGFVPCTDKDWKQKCAGY